MFRIGLIISIVFVANGHETVSKIDRSQYSIAEHPRYILYDVNPGEGFNLRRDVYMRIANTVRLLRQTHNYVLVLPPWRRLHHWRHRDERAMPWNLFFDLKSLNRFVPVVEFGKFVEDSNRRIDQVLYLQHYAEGWGEEFVKKFDERPCISPIENFYRLQEGTSLWRGSFFADHPVIRAKSVKCVSIQGDSQTLKRMIVANFSSESSVLIDRAETILHENYGETEYWRARRSMRYAPELVKAAADFRREYLHSTDEQDNTILEEDWTMEKPRRSAVGGSYIGVHWRRRDFLYARKEELPSIEGTARLLRKLCEKLKLFKIYLATDAPTEEIEELRLVLDNRIEIVVFSSADRFTDGQIAIIDQIIAAHARYFIGSHESTFSFRIQEDREILGFPVETTFNRLCPDANAEKCEQPAKWKIVY